VLLPRNRVGDFATAARAAAARFYPDIARNDQYASIISDRQHERLTGLRDQAIAAGARAEALGGGSSGGGVDPAQPRRLLPTLLTGVQDDMAVMQEEIFGPLLPVVTYDTLDDAIAYVSARPHPLALYLFERDRGAIEKVLARTIAGGVTVNDTLYHIAQHHLPFGGVGPSGSGGYHGQAGFRTFSHLKPVFRQARLNGTGLLNPPYGARFRRMLDLLLQCG